MAANTQALSVYMGGQDGLQLEMIYTLSLSPEAFFHQRGFVLSEDPLSHSCSALPLRGQPPRSRVVRETVRQRCM